jgi:hypothetical protein
LRVIKKNVHGIFVIEKVMSLEQERVPSLPEGRRCMPTRSSISGDTCSRVEGFGLRISV